MGQGLECYNANAQLILGTGDSISKVIGTVTTQQNVAGSVTVPDMAGGVRVFIAKYTEPPMGPIYQSVPRCQVSVSGRTISWSAGRGPIFFSYGVY
jgi:hypothetical protein